MRGLIRVVGAGVPRSKDLLWPRLDQSNYSCFQPVEFKWSVDLKFLFIRIYAHANYPCASFQLGLLLIVIEVARRVKRCA